MEKTSWKRCYERFLFTYNFDLVKKEIDAMKSKFNSFSLRTLAIVSSFLRMLPVFLVSVVALLLAVTAPELWAKKHQSEIPFSRAKIIIEFNASANDVGVQVLLDGEPWQWVKIKSPDGRKILNIMSRRSLKKQGLTELFFESSEPSLDEVPLAEFLARFPKGEYEFTGKAIDGIKIEGKATFTHVIPAGPKIVLPLQGDIPPVVDPTNLVIEWEPVTKTITDSDEINIVGYQVIVEQVEPLRVLSVDLPASVTNLKIPPEFFLLKDTLHKFEVLAIEEGGNQTITEGSFMTQP